MHRFSPRRLLVALRHTSPIDRVAITIVLLFIFFEVFSYAGRPLAYGGLVAFFAFLSLFYLLIRILPWIRSHVLWRLRYRLIAAYIFIAVVPLVLLLTMVGVASYLLYLELGAHLLNDDLQDRVSILAVDADEIAGAIQQQAFNGSDPSGQAVLSREPVAELMQAARHQWPQLEVSVARGASPIHLPDGNHFSGLAERRSRLCFGAIETRTAAGATFTILLTSPVTPGELDGLRSELGQVQLMLFRPIQDGPHSGLTYRAPDGQLYTSGPEVKSGRRALQPAAGWYDFHVQGYSILDAKHLDSDTGTVPVFATFALRPSALNRRLFTSVGDLGPTLVVSIVVVGIIFLIIEIAALATGVVLTRTITRAVGDLHEATLHVRRGDFSHRIRVHQRDQLGDLAESFNEMASSVSDLIVEQGRRQRLENEVAIAREVQEQLFPRSLPSLPGLQLAAICRPARSVSGDYYDFIRLGPTRVGIALADISGKGIFAALLMASLQAALRSTASMDGKEGTARLVARLNAHVFQNTADDRYATFFYSVYDTESHTLTYTNAGHLAPYFVTSEGVQQLDTGGTVIGMFEETNYTQGIVKVPPDSTLVAFSDGLTEPENVYGEEFGMQRVRDEILRHRATAPDRLAEFLIAAADQWAGTPEQADDITVVVARMS